MSEAAPGAAKAPSADPHPPVAASACREVSSAALLQGARELAIRHGGKTYRLRLTSQDKLILTK